MNEIICGNVIEGHVDHVLAQSRLPDGVQHRVEHREEPDAGAAKTFSANPAAVMHSTSSATKYSSMHCVLYVRRERTQSGEA